MTSLVKGQLRQTSWLLRHRYGPNVFGFRNLESGQVLFSQVPFIQQYYRDELFKYSSRENRLPNLRSDLWRTMVVVELPTHQKAVEFYQDLTELRVMRDKSEAAKADKWRKKDEDTGRVWSWGQFRPTYTQEAVADLISAAEVSAVEITMHWEDAWRRGADSHWTKVNVTHECMPVTPPSQKFVILKKIGNESFKRALKTMEDGTAEDINKAGWKEYQPKPKNLNMEKMKSALNIDISSSEAELKENLKKREDRLAKAQQAFDEAQQAAKNLPANTSSSQKRLARVNLHRCEKSLKTAEKLRNTELRKIKELEKSIGRKI